MGRYPFWLVAASIAILFLAIVGILSFGCGAGWLQVSFGRREICASKLPPDGPRPVAVEKIQEVAKLVSVEAYLAADVHYTSYADVPPWLREVLEKLGVRDEVLILAYGTVVAGFDLEDLTDERLWIDGSRVQLQLPRPKILYRPNIDHRRIRTIYHSDRCPNVICTDSVEIAVGAVLVEAEEKMLIAAEEIGLLDQAADSGRRYFEQFFESLGYEQIRVSVDGYD